MDSDFLMLNKTLRRYQGSDPVVHVPEGVEKIGRTAFRECYGVEEVFLPSSVKEIAARGHEIGNHSDSHAHFTQISESKIRQELDSCSDKIEALTVVRPTLFRPPYGDYNSKVITVVRDEGYEAVQWSIDSLDWKNRGISDLVKRATTNVQPGDIILFHNDSEYIVEALPAILQFYQEQGFDMIPAKDILLSGDTTIDVQGKQHPAAAR